MPKVGDHVWISFVGGKKNYPHVLWEFGDIKQKHKSGDDDLYPATDQNIGVDNNLSRGGQGIRYQDLPGAEKLTIDDSRNKNFIEIRADPPKAQDNKGNTMNGVGLLINIVNSILSNCVDYTVDAKGNINLLGTNTSITSDGELSLSASADKSDLALGSAFLGAVDDMQLLCGGLKKTGDGGITIKLSPSPTVSASTTMTQTMFMKLILPRKPED